MHKYAEHRHGTLGAELSYTGQSVFFRQNKAPSADWAPSSRCSFVIGLVLERVQVVGDLGR